MIIQQWYLCETKRIENEVFDDVRYKVCIRPMHCDIECWLWRMKTANAVYFQSCQLMFRALVYMYTSISNIFEIC